MGELQISPTKSNSQPQIILKKTPLYKAFATSIASPANISIEKMGANTITVTNNSTSDVSVSVTYHGNDFQKGGSELWYTLKANGGSDTWNYRSDNQIVRVARSQNAGTGIESFLAVPGKTIYIN
ncbi:hypothetical protein BELL_0682g00020 [Botrytis elliptica]|uniref:Uncharacterized protein n=2 Tax=Botrytis TaxID=33196 RepID=A0A4Z1JAJ7_9HELO|nr:hypothetical protein BELL_0682g00020 [Botrytis elliptica]